MRKGFLMVLAVALVAVLAAPAVAGTDVNGFYRAKGYVTNFDLPSAPSITDDMQSGSYVEQRLRVRFAFGEENVKAIWFTETDFGSWGDSAGSAAPAGPANRNVGGALGGDKVNLETKNIYVWFKVPNTSLDFQVGLQNQTDTFQGFIYGYADMAGIFATGKYEPVSWKAGWAKLYENNVLFSDDVDLLTLQVGFPASKDLKLGISGYYFQDDSQKYPGTLPGASPLGTFTAKIYTFGLDGAWNAGAFGLSGFFFYQFGTADSLVATADDTDISAFAADLRLDANLGPGKLFVEGIITSGGDNSGNDYQAPVTLADRNASPGGNSYFARMDFQILMPNLDDINQNTCIIGCAGAVVSQSPGNQGRGIWAVGAGYSMKVAEKTNVKIGAGYLAAMKTLQGEERDKDMGMEFNGNVNYNIMKGLDFGFYAAYAFLGGFFEPTVGGVTAPSPDDVYSLFLRLNYAF
jgi:hypothetical protein